MKNLADRADSAIEGGGQAGAAGAWIGNIRAILGALLCAGLVVASMLSIFPSAATEWDASEVVASAAEFFAPLALMCWSIVGQSSLRARALRWIRIGIVCHLILAMVEVVRIQLLPFISEVSSLRSLELSVVAIAIDVCLLIVGPPASSRANVLRVYRIGLFGLSVGCLAVLFAWSIGTIWLVAKQAQVAAEGRRYCLMLPIDAESHYRPVGSRLDLQGLKLRETLISDPYSAPGYRVSRGLALVVAPPGGPKLNANGEERGLVVWHWSHRERRFIPPQPRDAGLMDGWIIEPRRNYCVPRAGFVHSLRMFSASS